MDEDGSDLRRLTDSPESEDTPVWSPTGDKIAFRRITEDGSSEFWVTNADGSSPTLLAETEIASPEIRSASWSPDGSRLALQLIVDGLPRVYVVNANGTDLLELSEVGSGAIPYWSPTGDRILIQSGAVSTKLATTLTDGSEPIELTKNGYLPSWSPDGLRIAFVSNRDGNQEVYVMNADGSGLLNVSQDPGIDGPFGVEWSPDGTRFAFYSQQQTGAFLFINDADGSTPRTISLDANSQIVRIAWSLDSEYVALMSKDADPAAPSDILVISADGSDLMNVTQTSTRNEILVGWSSDSRRVLFVGDPPPTEAETGVALDIYAVDADGSNLTPLSDDPSSDYQAALSPVTRGE